MLQNIVSKIFYVAEQVLQSVFTFFIQNCKITNYNLILLKLIILD